MADQTTSSIDISAPPAEVMRVIADFEAYPEWAQGVHVAQIKSRHSDGTVKDVYYEIEATPIKDSYILTYDWRSENEVRWTLSEGKMLKRLEGSYQLSPVGTATHVTYSLAVELGIPMIGMLKRKAEKVIIDTALKGLKKRVEEAS